MDLLELRDLGVDLALLDLLEAADMREQWVVKPGTGGPDWRVITTAGGRVGALYAGRRALTLALDPDDAQGLAAGHGFRVVKKYATTWRLRVPAAALGQLALREVVLEAVVRALLRTHDRTRAPRHLPAEDPDVHDAATAAVPSIDVAAVLLDITRRWHCGMDEEAVYDVVQGWWPLGPRRELADVALAVADGEVRAVFRCSSGARDARATVRSSTRHRACRGGLRRRAGPRPRAPRRPGRARAPAARRHGPGEVRQLRRAGARVSGDPVVQAGRRPPHLDELREVCARLHANPVLHMSLHSKELFHSNTLAWLVEAHRELGAKALAPWLVPDPEQQVFRVRREHRNLDLVVELPGFRPLVVENKTFSLPDEGQLSRYDAVNLPRAGLPDATRLLLSLPDPGWTSWQGWTWVSYDALAEQLAPLVDPLAARDPFAARLVEHYLDLVRDLLHVAKLTRVQDDSEPVYLDADQVALLRSVRLHGIMQKLRARQLMRRLAGLAGQDRSPAPAIRHVNHERKRADGDPPVLPNGDALGWQLRERSGVGSSFPRRSPVEECRKGEAGGVRLLPLRVVVRLHHRAGVRALRARAGRGLQPLRPGLRLPLREGAPAGGARAVRPGTGSHDAGGAAGRRLSAWRPSPGARTSSSGCSATTSTSSRVAPTRTGLCSA